MKQIPYGIDDFERIIREDYYYIDKSKYIKSIEEQSSYILFVRPRRMGKSLFTNMMLSYYDISKKDQFTSLFGNLWIGNNPTKWHNQFLVLKFDFSKVNSEIETLGNNFSTYCFARLRDFLDRYDEYYPEEEKEIILKQPIIKEAIVSLVERSKLRGLPPIYLFIDEYDNFSNIVLSVRGLEAHAAITHGEGFYRDFFKACKGAFERVYMTGVTPVTYDDLTSGFNILDFISLYPGFDQTIGVSETELREMIEYYRMEGKIDNSTDNIIAEMKPWYDNFCFCEDAYGKVSPIYNTDMVMRYINILIKTGNAPKEMLDSNAQTDYKKLNYLVMTEDLANREQRIQTLKEICAKGYITGHVKEQFPASRCGDEANFKSMLYYFGTLTFGGWDEDGATILKVPNKTMGELYLQYMLQIINQEGANFNETQWSELRNSIADAAIRHDWIPMVRLIGNFYYTYSSIRNSIRGEADIQGFLRGLLCLNRYFELWPELELSNGFCDILLIPKKAARCPTKYSYLIEIKYLNEKDNEIQKKINEACHQLEKYSSDVHLSSFLHNTPLTRLYLIFKGNNLVKYGSI